MLELRWLKGSWGFGKYKLQWRDRERIAGEDWFDVQEVEEKPREPLWLKMKNELKMTTGCAVASSQEDFESIAKIAEEHFKGKHNE